MKDQDEAEGGKRRNSRLYKMQGRMFPVWIEKAVGVSCC
jgi:hypothetical protein